MLWFLSTQDGRLHGSEYIINRVRGPAFNLSLGTMEYLINTINISQLSYGVGALSKIPVFNYNFHHFPWNILPKSNLVMLVAGHREYGFQRMVYRWFMSSRWCYWFYATTPKWCCLYPWLYTGSWSCRLLWGFIGPVKGNTLGNTP